VRGRFHKLRLAEAPPHPDLLPARGEKERAVRGGASVDLQTTASLERLNLRLANEDEILRRDRDRSIDAEDRDLELVARLDGVGEHHPIGLLTRPPKSAHSGN
jgi:hypothetical protein